MSSVKCFGVVRCLKFSLPTKCNTHHNIPPRPPPASLLAVPIGNRGVPTGTSTPTDSRTPTKPGTAKLPVGMTIRRRFTHRVAATQLPGEARIEGRDRNTCVVVSKARLIALMQTTVAPSRRPNVAGTAMPRTDCASGRKVILFVKIVVCVI